MKRVEYLGYAGENPSYHTSNPQWFSKDEKSKTFFDRPVLRLKSVCWMNVWAEVEKIELPNSLTNTLDLFFYHTYDKNFVLENDLIV